MYTLPKIERYNQKICIKGEMAFESHDQTITLEDGTKLITYEIKVLQKVDNVWKIHASSVQSSKAQ